MTSNSEIRCVNDLCTSKKHCQLYNNKSTNVARLSSEDGFSRCQNFSCHKHQFIHVHGQRHQECANCGLAHHEQKNVSHNGTIEWSFE